ncbi:MAG: thioredoxin family protein [Spirochaetia bacterium]|nr:thioredoxin family protein [Spirochaetia bacterium]
MKRRLALLTLSLLVFSTLSVFAADHPAKKIQIKYKESISVPPGGSAALTISLTVPKGYHIYLKHAAPDANAILTEISIPPESGFELQEVRRPVGTLESDEMVLRNSGEFSVLVMDRLMHKTEFHRVPLKIRLQICQDDPAVCFLPTTIEKTLTVRRAGIPFASRASTSEKVKWVTTYDQAIAQAKTRKLNIFALISNPATCGACVALDSNVLSRDDVAEFLNKKFVPLNVPRGDYGKFVSGSFGIPTYFAVSPDGKKLKTFVGAPGSESFLSGLKPYAGTEAENITPPTIQPAAQNKIELNNGSQKCFIELKKSYAYQASQKGEFQNNGNVRIVNNSSAPGTYTYLHIGRTAEIEASYNARLSNGRLVVERYLAKDNLELACADGGITGKIPSAEVEVNILVGK